MNPIILVVINDYECRLQVESAASELSAECVFVSFGEHLTDLVKRTNPFLLIIEFNNDSSNWIQRHLSEIKADLNDFPVIGITGDSESDYTRLERAGCTRILTKPAFIKKTKSLIETYIR